MEISSYAMTAGWVVDFLPWGGCSDRTRFHQSRRLIHMLLVRWIPGLAIHKTAASWRAKLDLWVDKPHRMFKDLPVRLVTTIVTPYMTLNDPRTPRSSVSRSVATCCWRMAGTSYAIPSMSIASSGSHALCMVVSSHDTHASRPATDLPLQLVPTR